ncbi:hypothetical protein DKX38_017038 [Salix brachista]|uniref:Arf-GAP domain-containing protein n=1 Tax=Salix brachista TaxID=2182728 RepID=A0A5N5KUB8_9ROSI|nr:hypothetical protein DKX38_017038 [Salix brachista]
MNEKANVSKELNAKHRKVSSLVSSLSVLMLCSFFVVGYWKPFLNYQRIGSALTAKASRGPRWASVNLGIFICMQCSGIHRSLGVHISKVRSATLDTWLPEQIAFIQSMGNERSNNHWEAELPPNYVRVGIENFIRAKYEEKRWVPRDGKVKPPSRVSRERSPVYRPEPISGGHGRMNGTYHGSEERRITRPPNDSSPASRSSTPVPIKASTPLPVKASTPMPVKASQPVDTFLLPLAFFTHATIHFPSPFHYHFTLHTNKLTDCKQVARDTKLKEPVQKSEPAAPKADLGKKEESATKVVTPPKVDYATELFNLLCMDDSRGGNSTAPARDIGWTDLKESLLAAAEAKSTPERSGTSNFIQSTTQPNLTSPPLEKPLQDSNNDLMNLSNKITSEVSVSKVFFHLIEWNMESGIMASLLHSTQSSMVSPFSIHQQQLAMLSQQQQFHVTVAARSDGGSQTITANAHRPSSNGIHLPAQSWGSYGYQAPGMVMPSTDPQPYFQTGSSQQTYSAGNSINFPISSIYRPGSVAPINGMTNANPTMPPPAFPAAPTQPAGYFDLSSLAQGMYTKR